jgi:hypothetical protein
MFKLNCNWRRRVGQQPFPSSKKYFVLGKTLLPFLIGFAETPSNSRVKMIEFRKQQRQNLQLEKAAR